MKIELRKTGNKHTSGADIYNLYIDNNTDGLAYDDEGIALFKCPQTRRKRHVKTIKLIPCADIPNGMKLWNIINMEILPGELCVFEVERRRKKMRLEVWFAFKEKPQRGYINYPLNPLRLLEKIKVASRNEDIKVVDMIGSDDPVMPLEFEFMFDCNGTIGDKLNFGYKVIKKIVSQAYREQIKEANKYLNEILHDKNVTHEKKTLIKKGLRGHKLRHKMNYGRVPKTDTLPGQKKTIII